MRCSYPQTSQSVEPSYVTTLVSSLSYWENNHSRIIPTYVYGDCDLGLLDLVSFQYNTHIYTPI